MKFRYSARTKSGELQVGYIEAAGRDAAQNTLSGHDLYILSIERVEAPKWYHEILFFFKRVRRKDLALFTRQFATLLEAKIPIQDALTTLYYQTDIPALKEAIFEISSDINSGLSLSQSLEKHREIFFEFYVNLIQSAEVTGRVEEAMGYLAEYLEKELLLLSKVKNALIYPVFVVALSIIVGGILVGLVFPQISGIFDEAEFQLPFITRAFLAVGNFINHWWLAIVIFAVALVAILIDYLRSEEGKGISDELALNLPVVGQLFKKLYVARFAEVANVLIKGGIPIAQAIEISGHTSGSALYREMLHDIAEAVRRGDLLSRAFERYEKFFPPIVGQMVMVGEQTGKVDEMFGRIAGFYSREVDNIVVNLVELIQPMLMIAIGVLVGLLFAAILLPIYNLIQVIR